MSKVWGAVALVSMVAAGPASATDFGVRTLGMSHFPVTRPANAAPAAIVATPRLHRAIAPFTGHLNLTAAASVAGQWGRVTSTLRSIAHNRAVGGVSNSWHLKGRAIDIARRPGVTHAMIAAAFRAAGYHLMESLDEGDHSHFAFTDGERIAASPRATAQLASEATRWGMILAPGVSGR